MSDLQLVYITAPPQTAEPLATALLERGLVACVNLLPVRSVYRWKGAVQRDEESLLLCKTLREKLQPLEAAVRELHPYEVPEVVAVPAIGVHAPYADWVATEVRGQVGA